MERKTRSAFDWRRTSRFELTPFAIAACYAALSVVWIAYSDHLILSLTNGDVAALTRLQTLKGLAFVLSTAGLIYYLVDRQMSALIRSEEALKATINSLADAFIVADVGRNAIGANRSALRLLGLPERTDLRMPFSEVTRLLNFRYPNGQPLPLTEIALMQALEGQTVVAQETVVRSADGNDRSFSFSAAPVRDATGRVLMAVTLGRDMSELKRLATLRDEFLSTAAHELKTPITTIKGYSQMLLKWASPDTAPREKAAYQVLIRQADQINRVVEELIEVSRFRLGRLELRKSTFDLSELVTEVAGRMQAIAKNHRLLVGSPAPAMVEGDRERIDQVLVNLIDNAMKFSPKGGDVEVQVQTADGRVIVMVRDHGIGIPKEKQPYIFEEFFRAHAGTPYDFGGMGIGLHLCHDILVSHGGSLWCESEEGKGTTIYLGLPLKDENDRDHR